MHFFTHFSYCPTQSGLEKCSNLCLIIKCRFFMWKHCLLSLLLVILLMIFFYCVVVCTFYGVRSIIDGFRVGACLAPNYKIIFLYFISVLSVFCFLYQDSYSIRIPCVLFPLFRVYLLNCSYSGFCWEEWLISVVPATGVF